MPAYLSYTLKQPEGYFVNLNKAHLLRANTALHQRTQFGDIGWEFSPHKFFQPCVLCSEQPVQPQQP